MFLPRFSGDGNPESWIFRAELYFTYLGFDVNDWLPLPSFYLDGEALDWFNSFFCNKLFLDWKHFKGKFVQRFRQQTNNDVVKRVANSSQVQFYCANSVPIVSQSVVLPPNHVSALSTLDSPDKTSGNSKVDHVFDKMPKSYTSVDALALISGSSTETETLEDRDSTYLGNAKSVEGANLISEPFNIVGVKVFDEISPTIVSFEINDLNTDEEDNPRDSVALFDKCPEQDTSGFLVPFPSQCTVLLNGNMPIAAIKYPFDGVLWHYTIPCLYYSLEEMCEGKQSRVSPYIHVSLHNWTWVDTGQECTLPGFLSSNSRGCVSEEKIQKLPTTIVRMRFSFRQLTCILLKYFLMLNIEHLLVDVINLILSQFPFDLGAKIVTVPIHLTATNLCAWDSTISFTFYALMGLTVNVEALQLEGFSDRCCLISYSNSMIRVWDPEQSWRANSSILHPDSALVVALSPNFTHFYIVERNFSFYLTTWSSNVTGLTWRRNVLVFLLVWHAENKARYMDMRILETCLLKVNVFASLGTLLLWKDNFGLAPVAKYLYSFWSASIILILAYFHRCKSERLDTTKPLVSRSASLVLTRLVLLVGLGEKYCTTYSIQAVVVLTIGADIFNIGAGNDLPRRNSTDAKIIVPLIVVWTAGTCSLFIPWYSTLLLVHEEISSANLVFTTTLRICHMVNLHNTFMVLHSLRSWTKQLTMISRQRYRLEHKTEHMWLPLSNGIVITVPFNGIDGKKYVSPYESDILLLLTLFYLNLEDKVLIEGGSIVVNRVGYLRADGLQFVETILVGIIGPSKMLGVFYLGFRPN